MDNLILNKLLKYGKLTSIRINAKAVEINVIRMDSKKNWLINDLRDDPIALRTPTSLALRSDRAVDKFMKFTQAINRIQKASSKNIFS
ncbi:hypothetical protein D3C87_1195270 [compost metagenome]